MNPEDEELSEKKLSTENRAPGMGLDFLHAIRGRQQGKLDKTDMEVFAEDELIRKDLKELVIGKYELLTSNTYLLVNINFTAKIWLRFHNF